MHGLHQVGTEYPERIVHPQPVERRLLCELHDHRVGDASPRPDEHASLGADAGVSPSLVHQEQLFCGFGVSERVESRGASGEPEIGINTTSAIRLLRTLRRNGIRAHFWV